MADNRTVDNLNIRVTADVSQAKSSLQSLSNTSQSTMNKVSSGASGVRQAFHELPNELNNTNAGFKVLDGSIGNATSKISQLGAKIKNAFVSSGIAKYKGDIEGINRQAQALASEYAKLYASTKKYEETNNPQAGDNKFKERVLRLQELGYAYREVMKEQNAYFSNEASIGFNRGGLAERLAYTQGNIATFREKLVSLSDRVTQFGKRMLSTLNPLKRFSKDNKDASLSANALAKALGKTWMMLKRLVTRMILRGMITSVREGFKNLALYSDEVNKKISAIGSSLIQLKNAFAVAFMPLISAITPILTKIIDFISKAFNYVGEFMSAITGKNSWIATLKPAYDYAGSVADSTKDTAKNTGKIKKNLKEIKNATIGIDNLNVIAPNDNSTPSGSGGNGNGNKTPNVADMFTTKKVSKQMKKIANLVKKVAKKLFNPIEKAFNSQKKNLISSWKYALKEMLRLGRHIGKDFLDVWNSKATELIFEDVFEVIANIGVAIGNLAKQFRFAWDRNKVGKRIFEDIRDIIGIVVDAIKKCSEYTVEWTNHLNFTPLLEGVERYLTSFKKVTKFLSGVASDIYENFILNVAKWLVEKGIPALIDVFTDFNNKVDWESLRKHLNKVWKAVGHFTKAVGQGLIDFIHELADGIAMLVNSKWFKGFLDGIAGALNSIKPSHVKWFLRIVVGVKVLGKVAPKIAKLGVALKGIASFLPKIGKFLGSAGGFGFVAVSGLVQEFNWLNDDISKAKNNLQKAFDKKYGLPKELQKQLDKLDDINDRLVKNNETYDKANEKIINSKNEVFEYKNALDQIVDGNGKIKAGYEEQAELLIEKINDALGTNYEIVGNTIKDYQKISTQLEKQVELATLKALAEKNAEKYIKAQQSISAKGKEYSQRNADYTKASNEYKAYKKEYDWYIKEIAKEDKKGNTRRVQELTQALSEMGGEEKLKSLETNYKRLKKSLGKSKKAYEGYYKDIIRQEALYNAKTSKERKKAIANFTSDLTKGEKKNLDVITEFSNKTGISVDKVLRDYTKNGVLQADKLPKKYREVAENIKKSINSIPEKKETKVTAKAEGVHGVFKTIDDLANKKRKVKVDVGLNNAGDVKGLRKKLIKEFNNMPIKIHTVLGSVRFPLTEAVFKKVDGGKKNVLSLTETKKWGVAKFSGKYADGGFPRLGSFFIAGEKGSELVGNINGKTGVASNQEITGIKSAIENQGGNETQLLIEQNRLLRALLEKDTDIVLDGKSITKTVNGINARSGKTLVTV